MASEIQAEANRRNALQSTGPKTGDGIEAARFNALRHGLRALQTVVPGEAPEEWESHRAAIVEHDRGCRRLAGGRLHLVRGMAAAKSAALVALARLRDAEPPRRKQRSDEL